MKEYIKESVLKAESINRQYYIHSIPIKVVHEFSKHINLGSVVKQIETLVPVRLLRNVDVVYVAHIKDFIRGARSFNAMYKDGAIYISPEQDNEQDLLDDIIHEIAHSLENEYQDYIYGDDSLEREFLSKRSMLYHMVDTPTFPKAVWYDPQYSAIFDDHIFNDIGYDKLRIISAELFYSPYAITSLREYWANGFESYLLGDKQRLKDISPALYNKIVELFEH